MTVHRVRVLALAAAVLVSAGAAAASTHGPVTATETLWSLAERFRPDETVSVQRMMLALLKANPDAFTIQNVNALKVGAVLRIPTREEIGPDATAEALAEVRRQHAEWGSLARGGQRKVASRLVGDLKKANRVVPSQDAFEERGDDSPVGIVEARAALVPVQTLLDESASPAEETRIEWGPVPLAASDPSPVAWRVAHDHLSSSFVYGCDGEVFVSAEGFRFVTEDSDHSFNTPWNQVGSVGGKPGWGPAAFNVRVADRRTRTFNFRIVGAKGTGENKLEDLLELVARFHR